MSIKKMVALILACVLSVTALAGCQKDPADDPQNAEPVFVGKDALSEYVIVRSDTADEETVSATSKLYSEL